MTYEDKVKLEIFRWQQELLKQPSAFQKESKAFQTKLNGLYPKKYHELMTVSIKQMTKAVIVGAAYTTHTPRVNLTLKERDQLAEKVIATYTKIGMVEGAGTGYGGLLIGLTDFPLLLSIKMKLLYELAAIYGCNTASYKERIYMLTLFELTFSSYAQTRRLLNRLQQWEVYKQTIPEDMADFDWYTFQQEYRDYLDVAKLMQLLPLVGAPIGAYVNHKLVKKLGENAIQAYRMRWTRYN